MNRTRLAAVALLPACVASAAGCSRQPSAPPPAPAPLVLAELRAASPGPWRHEGREPIAVTALDRSSDALSTHAPSATSTLPAPTAANRPTALPPRQAPASPPADRPRTRAVQPPAGRGAGRVLGEPRRLVALTLRRDPRQAGAITQTGVARGMQPAGPRRIAAPETLLREAAEHAHRGFRLSQRDALYLAQAEFLTALERVADAHDLRRRTRLHSQALNAGLLALAESSDFLASPTGARPLDVAQLVRGHGTPVLRHPPVKLPAAPLAALRYREFAYDRLAVAAAGNTDASMALLGLGRVAMRLELVSPAWRAESAAEGTMFFEAAVLADPANFRAAGELSAILIGRGEWIRARDVLARSVGVAPHASTHRQLATVYTRLGETQLATRSTNLAAALERRGGNHPTNPQPRR